MLTNKLTNISLEALPVLVMTCFEMEQAEGDSSILQQCDHIVGQGKQHLAVFIMISEVTGWMMECCHSNSTAVYSGQDPITRTGRLFDGHINHF